MHRPRTTYDQNHSREWAHRLLRSCGTSLTSSTILSITWRAASRPQIKLLTSAFFFGARGTSTQEVSVYDAKLHFIRAGDILECKFDLLHVPRTSPFWLLVFRVSRASRNVQTWYLQFWVQSWITSSVSSNICTCSGYLVDERCCQAFATVKDVNESVWLFRCFFWKRLIRCSATRSVTWNATRDTERSGNNKLGKDVAARFSSGH